MRVLHVSNFVQRHKGRLFWNHAFKISNGFIRNGHSVYNFSDRDISKINLINKFNNEKNTNIDLITTFKNLCLASCINSIYSGLQYLMSLRIWS